MTNHAPRLVGHVIRSNMDKTVKVRFAKTRMHPIVLKPVTTHKNVLAHDELNQCVVGDVVGLEASPSGPISVMKRFLVKEIIQPAIRTTDPETGKIVSQRIAMRWNSQSGVSSNAAV
ncbi:hypothetical protein SeMB42_g05766 [Synchytrium endobioticum]|uniref:30S ribosomal protein S17 n=1 Tax=Synchytrium endobioticum TaxID=286115 RepID=A0A507CPG4_9FUNG|nr:hypothetical protein SeMB42_g05766 [Synchytrium endobioticum]